MKVYDCFTFFNELDVLEIRLNELAGVVDRFVLVESTRTHSNKEKPLHFADNKDRFKAFEDRITHVVVDKVPDVRHRWVLENYQRNSIVFGWSECEPEDLVLVSDVDEIPHPEAVARVRSRMKDRWVYAFGQTLYYYYLNGRDGRWFGRWFGTVGANFRKAASMTPQVMRDARNDKRRKRRKVVRNGGWHFAWLGGPDAIVNKIESFAHAEFDTEHFKDRQRIARAVESGVDIFSGSLGYKYVEIDESFPSYVQRNADRFAHLIHPV